MSQIKVNAPENIGINCTARSKQYFKLALTLAKSKKRSSDFNATSNSISRFMSAGSKEKYHFQYEYQINFLLQLSALYQTLVFGK